MEPLDMTTLEREQRYLRRWRGKAIRGDRMAMANVAATYRILGNYRLAARWWKKVAEQGDGNALTEWGYCLQHGVGVRRDTKAAERAYRAAIVSKDITECGREEAMYHLAVLLLGKRSASSRRAALKLLQSATADQDYPQAEALLRSLGSEEIQKICTCHRHLRPRLARRHCRVHGHQRV
jgi:TPR repeat protein